MSERTLSGSNIQDTYHRLVQTDGESYYDGTGSVLTGTLVDTGSLGSLRVNGTVSSSGQITAGGGIVCNGGLDVAQGGAITASIISSSSDIYVSNVFSASIKGGTF